MKAAFFHDGPTLIDKNHNYYACVLNNKIIDRYFYFADEFVLVNHLVYLPDEVPEGLERINHNNTNIIEVSKTTSLRNYITKTHKVKKVIEAEVRNADVIIARLPSIVGGYAARYAIEQNKPFLVEVVGCTWDALWNYSLKGKMMAPIMMMWTRELIRKSPYVIYVTQKFLQRRYPNKFVNEGISDVDIPDSIDDVLSSRLNKIENKKGSIILGTIASVDIKYKGQRHVIKAVSLLKKQGFKVEYHLVGGGNQSYLRNIAEKYNVRNEIIFLGPLPHDEVFSFLDKIDIYIQPSDAEALSRSLIEAMSRACPCIGSNVGGIPELLDKKCLFQKGNADQLSELIKKYKKDFKKEQSVINFNTAKNFRQSYLDNKRKNFYDRFFKNM